MEYYTLALNSNNETAIPIAKISDPEKTIIDLKKKKDDQNIKKNVTSAHSIIPIFFKQPDQVLRLYVSGMSGSGKSTFVAQMVEQYHKLYKEDKIYMFSTLETDKAYDKKSVGKHIIRYQLTDENAELLSEIREEDVRDSLVIFDDFLIFEPKLRKIVDTLKLALLRRGRHYNISTIVITQKLLGGHQTITELTQCNYIVVFPLCNKASELTTFYTEYVGLEKDQINQIKKIKSRWITFHMIYPKYIVSQHSVQLLT